MVSTCRCRNPSRIEAASYLRFQGNAGVGFAMRRHRRSGTRHETENKLDAGRVLRILHRRGGARRRCCDRRHQVALIRKIDNDVKCLLSTVEAGDPTTSRSTLILKASSGCVVPWHYHTAEEQLIVISGTVLVEMVDHQPTRLGPGGFAVMGAACRISSPATARLRV